LTLPARPSHELTIGHSIDVPSIVAAAGEDAAYHFIAFFVSELENPNTRAPNDPPYRKFPHGCCQQPLLKGSWRNSSDLGSLAHSR